MNKQILIALALCMLFAGFASADGDASTVIGIGDGSGSDCVMIPISVTNADNVGSIHVNLTFDPEIVTVMGVTDSDMDRMLANLEHIEDGYVHVIAYQTSSSGLDGSFDVAQVFFKSVSDSGSCPLGIDVITFKDSTPVGVPMAYIVSEGVYTAVSYTPPPCPTPPSPNPTPCPTCPPSPNPTPCPTCPPSPNPTPCPTPSICSIPIADISLVSQDGMTVVVNANASIGTEESWVYGNPCIMWNDGHNAENVSNGNHSHTYSEEGNFTITLVAQNTCGRWATATINVMVSTPLVCPEVNANVTLVSKSDLTVIVDVQMSPGAGATWANNSPRIDWGDDTQDNPVPNGANTHQYADADTYTIGVYGVSSCGKNNHSTINVTVSIPPVAPVVLHLYPGWNLMAVPVNDPTADTAAELASKITGCKEVVMWNASTQMYVPRTKIGDDWAGTDFTITTDMGIFVNVEGATNVSFRDTTS